MKVLTTNDQQSMKAVSLLLEVISKHGRLPTNIVVEAFHAHVALEKFLLMARIEELKD